MNGKRILAVLVCSLFVCMGVCEALSQDISAGVVRLHVVANSDTEQDQSIKILVRDSLLAKMEELSKGEPYDLLFAQQHKDILTETANAVLAAQGASYRAQVETGTFSFPTKRYQNVTLPCGDYDAVRVVLGAGAGQNWWCVMFPPLCFLDGTTGEMTEENRAVLKQSTGDCAYRLITDEEITLKPAFKALELWANMKDRAEQTFFRKEA